MVVKTVIVSFGGRLFLPTLRPTYLPTYYHIAITITITKAFLPCLPV